MYWCCHTISFLLGTLCLVRRIKLQVVFRQEHPGFQQPVVLSANHHNRWIVEARGQTIAYYVVELVRSFPIEPSSPALSLMLSQ